MAKFHIIGLLLLRAALVGTTGLALFTATEAAARVGVTAATEGDPIGKPPDAAARVLHVGTDVQANEIITTSNNDRAHVIFLDGTTLTVGPNAQFTIDKFVYDENTKKGELAINATKGVFRVIGGRISKTSAITVTTPSATMGIRGGIMVFGIDSNTNATTSIFVYGDSMTVTAQGQTTTVTTPGMQVATNPGSPPGVATVVVQGSLSAALAALTGNTKAAAAVLDAINTIVADNLNNTAVLATLTILIQSIINQNAPGTIGTQTTTLVLVVTENPNQAQTSPQ
jgi:hypothetical protein